MVAGRSDGQDSGHDLDRDTSTPSGPPSTAPTEHAVSWLESLDDRPVSPRVDADAIKDALGRDLPEGPTPPEEVVDLLATACEPGLVGDAVRSLLRLRHRRLPAGRPGRRLAGQRLGPEHGAPQGHPGRDRRWRSWPGPGSSTCSGSRPRAASALPTGATMANFTGLVAARDATLRARGGTSRGARRLAADPGAGRRERHSSADLALRYVGLPAAELVDADDEGRIRPDALRRPSKRHPTSRRSCCCRRATCTPERATRSRSASRCPRARGLGARRRSVRALGGGLPVVPPPDRGSRARRLVGDGRAQDAERALRLRHRRRP